MAEATKANYKLGELHFHLVLQKPWLDWDRREKPSVK
jgi:hypothetical protein